MHLKAAHVYYDHEEVVFQEDMSNHSAILDDRNAAGTPTSSTSLSPSPSRRGAGRGRSSVLATDMLTDERRMTVLERNK